MYGGGKFLIVSLMYLAIESSVNINVPDIAQWKTTFACYPYFFIGVLIKESWISLTAIFDNYKRRIIMVIILTVIYMLSFKYNGESLVVLMRNCFGNNIFLSILSAISMSCLLILIFMRTRSSSLVRTLSEGTLLIFATHSLFAGIVSKINPISGEVLGPWVASVIIVILYYLPIVFCQRYIPILLGKSFKK